MCWWGGGGAWTLGGGGVDPPPLPTEVQQLWALKAPKGFFFIKWTTNYTKQWS